MRTLKAPAPAPQAAGAAANDRIARRWGPRLLVAVSLAWCASFVAGFQVTVTLLTLLGVVLALNALRNPVLAFFGVSLLCTLDTPTRFYMISFGLWRWNTVNYLLLLAAVAGGIRCRSFRSPQSRILFAFVGVLVLGLLWSLSPGSGAQEVLAVLSFWGLLVFGERAGESRQMWYWIALVNGAVVTLVNLAFFRSSFEIQKQMNPNAWGSFCLPGIFLCCLALGFGTGSPKRDLKLALLVTLNAGWVFLTGSRGASLTAVLCLLFLLVRGGVARRGVVVAGVVVLICGGLFFAEERARSTERITKLFDTDRSLSSRTSGRSELALAGWYLFLDNPIAGVGTGGFAPRWARLGDAPGLGTFAMGGEKRAHAGWIQTMAENGLPGLLLLAGFVGSFALTGWRLRSSGVFLVGLWISAALAGALISTEIQASGLWLLSASGCLQLHRRAMRSLRSRPIAADGAPAGPRPLRQLGG